MERQGGKKDEQWNGLCQREFADETKAFVVGGRWVKWALGVSVTCGILRQNDAVISVFVQGGSSSGSKKGHNLIFDG